MPMNKIALIFIVVLVLIVGIIELRKPMKPTHIEAEKISTSTVISSKPRDKIITYITQKGDTVQSIGQRFSISPDTVKWANHLTTDSPAEGQSIKILPVTGIAHVVIPGDTVDTLAKKYNTDPQKIIDFPFNDFVDDETHNLIPGKTLIIPNGQASN
jgi:LysM repeat protein